MQGAECSACRVSRYRIVLPPVSTWRLLLRACLLHIVSFIFSTQFIRPLAGTLEKLRPALSISLTLSESREGGCPCGPLSEFLKLVFLGNAPCRQRKGVIAFSKCGNQILAPKCNKTQCFWNNFLILTLPGYEKPKGTEIFLSGPS